MLSFLLIISLINVKIIICAENSDLTNNTNAVTEKQKQEFVQNVEVPLQSENDKKQRNNTLLKDDNVNDGIPTTSATKVVQNNHTSTDLSSTTKKYDKFITNINETIETDNLAKHTIDTVAEIKNEEKKLGAGYAVVAKEKNVDTSITKINETVENVTDNFAKQTINTRTDINDEEKKLETVISNVSLKRRNATETDQFHEKLSSNIEGKKDDEIQHRYVPVHIYDAENAYFNSYSYQGPDDNSESKEKILRHYPNIVKEIQTRFKSSKVKSSNNLTMEQVERNSSRNIKIQAMRPDEVLKKLNIAGMKSSEENNSYEKPLKHSLNKIRKIMFKKKLAKTKKEESNRNKLIFKQLNDVNDDDSDRNQDDNSDLFWATSSDSEDTGNDRDVRHEINSRQFIEGLKKFSALLQTLVGRIDGSENSKIETDSDEDSDTNTYDEVINSLKLHNKIKNSDIHDMVVRLEKISKNEKYKSRFNIVNREEHTLESEEPVRIYLEKDVNEPVIFKYNSKKPNAVNMDDVFLKLHVNHLKDIAERDDDTLINYDWLRTTIIIQAAIAKLQEIIDYHRLRIELPPADKRLLKVTLYLYTRAAQSLADREDHNSQRSMPLRMSKYKNRKPFNILQRFFNRKDINLIRRSLDDTEEDIENLDWALHCLRICLNDLHTVIRKIGAVTTYKNQHWFQGIKQLYLKDGKEKEYLQLFLHLVTAKAVRLLDELSQNMATDDEYLRRNLASFERIGAEFTLIMRTCAELMKLKD